MTVGAAQGPDEQGFGLSGPGAALGSASGLGRKEIRETERDGEIGLPHQAKASR